MIITSGPRRCVELLGDVALQLGELHEVAKSLLAEVDAVGIDDDFEAARPQPDIPAD